MSHFYHRGHRYVASLVCIVGVGIAQALCGAWASAHPVARTKPFCGQAIVKNYEKPLDGLPSAKALAGREHLPFGPAALHLYPASVDAGPRLLVGGGVFGYGFQTQVEGGLKLNWSLRAAAYALGGKSPRRVDVTRKRIQFVGGGKQPDITVSLPATPGLYRIDFAFKDRRDGILGAFRDYVRVLKPFRRVRLGISAETFKVGETLLGRLENIGTEEVLFGAPYAIETLLDGSWVRVGPGRHIWPRYIAGLKAGGAGGCIHYTIPSEFQAGRYRLAKQVEYEEGDLSKVIYAEFDVMGTIASRQSG